MNGTFSSLTQGAYRLLEREAVFEPRLDLVDDVLEELSVVQFTSARNVLFIVLHGLVLATRLAFASVRRLLGLLVLRLAATELVLAVDKIDQRARIGLVFVEKTAE